ncbi:hypothetical protein, partial [uncultured Desulfovibrio sp.]|uniref:hypothetical protein n=1 Tax=uncultured Desulfovibrio sp. TaxID=167968 RepID=UPI0026235F6B
MRYARRMDSFVPGGRSCLPRILPSSRNNRKSRDDTPVRRKMPPEGIFFRNPLKNKMNMMVANLSSNKNSRLGISGQPCPQAALCSRHRRQASASSGDGNQTGGAERQKARRHAATDNVQKVSHIKKWKQLAKQVRICLRTPSLKGELRMKDSGEQEKRKVPVIEVDERQLRVHVSEVVRQSKVVSRIFRTFFEA